MKKFFAIALATVFAVSCMMLYAFALSFDFEDGSLDEWTTHGGQGSLSVVDGALYTSGRWNGAYKTAYALGTLEAGKTYNFSLDFYAEPTDFDVDGQMTFTVSIVNGFNDDLNNNLDGEEYIAVNFTVPTGEWSTVSFEYAPETDATYAIFCVNTINHYAWDCQPEFYLDNVVVDGVEGVDYDIPVDEENEDENAGYGDSELETGSETDEEPIDSSEPNVDVDTGADDNTTVEDEFPADVDDTPVDDGNTETEDNTPVDEIESDSDNEVEETPTTSANNESGSSKISTVALVLVIVAVVAVVAVVIVVVKSKK